MCGRFALIPDGMKARYGLASELISIAPNYNASPGQFLPIVIRLQGQNQIDLMKWGLVPHWSKDDKIGYKMINARSETLLEKPSFKKPFEQNRCIIPISGFYEWKKLDEKHKIPFFIHFKDQPIISLAGIYSKWIDPNSQQDIMTFSIITTGANQQMQEIHERMPVMLNQEDETKYLTGDPKDAYELLKPSTEKLDIYEVSSLVNSVRNNSEDIMEKYPSSL
jgi:putative SOS response-associated peptidase YedK